MLLQNEGPANRPPLPDDSAPRLTAPTLEWGESPDIFQAEHGFSALITFTKDDVEHRVLFDTGLTPNGMVGNMRRLSLSPKDIEVIVLSNQSNSRESFRRWAQRMTPHNHAIAINR